MQPALRHLARGTGLTIGVVAAMLWPCVPASYDPLALPISMVARCVSWTLLIFVPIGVVWWCRDIVIGRPTGARILGAATLTAVIGTGAAGVVSAAAFGGVVLAVICASTVGMLLRGRWTRWTRAAADTGNGTVALLYLVAVPGLILALQLWLFEPAVTANRARLMTSAVPLITQLEE